MMAGFLDDLIGNINPEEEGKERKNENEEDDDKDPSQDAGQESQEHREEGENELTKTMYSDNFYKWCKTRRFD